MGEAAAMQGPRRDGRIAAGTPPGGVLLPSAVLWILLVVAGVGGYLGAGGTHLMMSTDDAMRLVQVRDLLAGQGWFDLHQHRLGLGAGTEMHWSRLVDAPIAALILALRPFLGAEGAEAVVIVVWPLFLILPLLACASWIGLRTGGRTGAWVSALVMAASVPFLEKFSIGALDHHNVQILMLVLAVTFAFRAFSSVPAAAGFGATLALCLAIGAETLPHVAVLAACAAVTWAVRGGDVRAETMAVAAAFAAVVALVFLGTAPDHAWRGGHCDGLTRDVALPFGAAALGHLAAGAAASPAPPAVRWAAVAATGAAALGAALAFAPACLSDPLAGIDPFLRTLWLDRVVEAKSLSETFGTSPGRVLAILAAGVLALAVSLEMALRGPERSFGALLFALILLSLAVAEWQMRGAVILLALSAIPNGMLVARVGRAYLSSRSGKAAVAAVGVLALSLPSATASLVGEATALLAGTPGPDAEAPDFLDCVEDDRMEALAELPPGVVSASSNLGPYVLLYTPHHALSAPYHRNVVGMSEQLRIALATPEAAEARLRAARVDYVLACPTDGEYAPFAGDSLARRLADGAAPAYLEPVGRDEPEAGGLLVYRLRPPT